MTRKDELIALLKSRMPQIIDWAERVSGIPGAIHLLEVRV
jgi:hypothetical protein